MGGKTKAASEADSRNPGTSETRRIPDEARTSREGKPKPSRRLGTTTQRDLKYNVESSESLNEP